MRISRTHQVLCISALVTAVFTAGCQSGLVPSSSDTVRFQDSGNPLPPFADIHVGNPKPKLDAEDFINDNFSTNNQSTSPNARRPDPSQSVREVKIKGNQRVKEFELLRIIRTRPGRLFDPDLLRQDVDDLWNHPKIRRISGP